MELVYVSLVSGFFGLAGIYLLYSLQTRKMKMEQQFNIQKFRLGKKYKLKEMEMPKAISSKGIKDRAIDGIIDRFISRYRGEEEEYEGEEGSIIDSIVDEVKNNPKAQEVIKEFIGGKVSKKEDNITDFR